MTRIDTSVPELSTLRLSESSRYKDTPLLRFPATNLEWGLWESDEILPESEEFTQHQITSSDVGRLDLLAYRYYGNPLFWWIIAHANALLDPVGDMVIGAFLRIPSREVVDQYIQRRTR